MTDSPRGSVYDAAGGMPAMERIAAAWHDLALRDPVVGHAFAHGFAPDHVERLSSYLAEALGGPAVYTSRYAPAATVARMHAGNGVHPDFDEAGIAVFDAAVDTAQIADPAAAASIKAYWAWTTRGPLNDYPDSPDAVPDDLPLMRWSWHGPV